MGGGLEQQRKSKNDSFIFIFMTKEFEKKDFIMDIQEIMYKVQVDYNQLGEELEKLVKNLVSLSSFEKSQSEIIGKLRAKVEEQGAVIQMLKSPPIGNSEKSQENQKRPTVAAEPTMVKESLSLKRKAKEFAYASKELKTQKTIESFYHNTEKPSILIKTAPISKNKTSPKQQSLIKPLIDSEGFTIISKKKPLKSSPNEEKTQESCSHCQILQKTLENISIKPLNCPQHSHLPSKVPDWYFKVIS